jgi:hexokinase
VDDTVKRLRSVEFFDWIATRIEEAIRVAGGEAAKVLPMGVTWSFPTEQTSLSSGNVLTMGKGFAISDEIAGTDLRQHFDAAFARRVRAL